MHFLVVGHVLHKSYEGKFFAYGPYVREMNRWFQFADKVTVVSPLDFTRLPDPIDLPYEHSNLEIKSVPEFNVLTFAALLKTLINIPGILFKIALAMRKADHIHLRCPGNFGLLGALVQIAFPGKVKTAKYAGNWDRDASKPFTFRLQQSILSNTYLSRSMTVLVYGEWPGESKNVYPFFTASYSKEEKEALIPRKIQSDSLIRLVFVGTLTPSKNPLLTAQVALGLVKNGRNIQLEFYGDGSERNRLEEFIKSKDLEKRVFIRGNVPAGTIKKALQNAHFFIFLSKSEGWPKVVAESMFWGCLPVTTRISCVPQMLGDGTRGNLVGENVAEVIQSIESDLGKPERYFQKTLAAVAWSRDYTLEKFELEIQNLLKN
jgi:glycosyltransferase involved in cell wall biosynthesis